MNIIQIIKEEVKNYLAESKQTEQQAIAILKKMV
jgi:hypothetical protein